MHALAYQPMDTGTLPAFPEFSRLVLDHREAIERAYVGAQPEVSELSFPELFAWRGVRKTQVSEIDGGVCAYLLRHGKLGFGPPVGARDPAQAIHRMLTWLRQQGEDGSVYALTDAQARLAEASGLLVAEEDPDNADYVYKVQDLIDLPGHKYDGKRNHINYFLRNNDFSFSVLSLADLPDVIEFEKRWYAHRHMTELPGLAAENQAVHELLNNYRDLPVEGAVIRIGGLIEAFTVSAELNRDTAVVIAEKANPEVRGLYQAINQMYCERVLSRFTWVNREQDAGDLGLRRAKLSYNPHHMVAKYRVRLRQS
jgi:uncharacterized protein